MSLLTRVAPALAGTALLLAPASAHAATGPYAGSVVQDETATHEFDNHPRTGACIQITTWYQVSVVWAPPGDTVTLTAGGKTATGSAGATSVSFEAGVCTAFGISVTGTAVADTAHYVVRVQSGPLGALGELVQIGG